MLRKLAAFILALVIAMTSLVTPAEAGIVETATDTAVTTAIVFLTPPAICLAADAVATTFFPPAALLAPYCASLAIPAGTTAVGGNLLREALQP